MGAGRSLTRPTRRLLVDPKQRKVILVENVLMPTVVKRTICQILFENLQVPSVCFLPSHLLSTVAIGRTSSIVLDLGYQEASLLPIQHGRGLTSSHLLISPRSGKRVARRLRALLLHHATFVPLPTSGNSGTLSGLKGKMTSEMLTPDFLDEIKAKTLLVGEPPGRVQDKQEESVTHTVENQQQDWAAGKPFAESDEADDEVLMRVLEKKYKQGSKAKDMVVSLPPLPREAVTPASNPATFGAPPLPLTSGRGALLIPGWVRERAAEVLFEPSDEDELNLVDMILTTLIKVSRGGLRRAALFSIWRLDPSQLPIDLRASLARNIYVVGGTAMLPGLAHRLRVEVVRRLVEARQDEAESGRPAMVALSTPRVGPAISATSQYAGEPRPIDTISESEEAPSNQHATGDDSFVTTMEANEEALAMLTLESKAMAHRRDVRDRFRWGPISSLAPVVAVLSDHAPRIDADGQPVGGIAPSFPVNLSSWIGASLLGCLRVEAMDQKSREMWDEEEEERRSAKDTRKKKDSHDRPSMGSGRGSFLGTVGGLDLGTYGPLSAGARGTFGGSNPRSPPLS